MANYTTAQVSFTFHYDGSTNLISIDINKGPLFYQGPGSLYFFAPTNPIGVMNVTISGQTTSLFDNKPISTTATISGEWLEVNIPLGLPAGSFTVSATLKY